MTEISSIENWISNECMMNLFNEAMNIHIVLAGLDSWVYIELDPIRR